MIKRLFSLLLAFAALPADASTPPCESVAGLANILRSVDARYFIFGELHGTTETAPLFADAICQAAAQSPVVVGLEIADKEQPLLDLYLNSDGRQRARAALLKSAHWLSPDGRGSKAMLLLIERLREMKREGKVDRVVAFVPLVAAMASQTPYNQAMASAWTHAVSAASHDRLFVLVGNVHASLAKFSNFEPAAMHLPHAQTVTFGPANVGGSAYNCQTDGCGVHPEESASYIEPRGITAAPKSQSLTVYDYIYSPGVPFTASLPAVPRK